VSLKTWDQSITFERIKLCAVNFVYRYAMSSSLLADEKFTLKWAWLGSCDPF